MTPTTTGAAAGLIAGGTLLIAWALMGFPTHDIPDIPPKLEAIAAAIVTVGAWSTHAGYTFVKSLKEILPVQQKDTPPNA